VTLDDLAAQKYISLATFKKDGTRVATPVWLAREGEHLYVITDPTSGKAKRLRNSPRAEVAPCDMRGTVTGPAAPASAVLLDEAGTAHVKRLIDAKYGLMATVFGLLGAVRQLLGKGDEQRVGIEITLTSSSEPQRP
jgi:PPOX class probable F420-dependent enzyme